MPESTTDIPTEADMTDAERLRRIRVLMDDIRAEASAFIEFNPHTDDAFLRIRGLAQQSHAITVRNEAV